MSLYDALALQFDVGQLKGLNKLSKRFEQKNILDTHRPGTTFRADVKILNMIFFLLNYCRAN